MMQEHEDALANEPSGDAAVRVQTRDAEDPSSHFFDHAIAWLRGTMRVSIAPSASSQERPGARLRVEGVLQEGSGAGRHAVAGLWALTLGAILAMISLPGMSVGARDVLHLVGYGTELVGVGLFAVAAVAHRRTRRTVMVELRAASACPIEVQSLQTLRSDAGSGLAWMVAPGPWRPEVLAEARRLDVRCFERQPGGYRDLSADPASDR